VLHTAESGSLTVAFATWAMARRAPGSGCFGVWLRVHPGTGCCGRCDTYLVRLTLLIVDDHEGFRRVARALLEADGIEVVGEAADGESAIAEAEREVWLRELHDGREPLQCQGMVNLTDLASVSFDPLGAVPDRLRPARVACLARFTPRTASCGC